MAFSLARWVRRAFGPAPVAPLRRPLVLEPLEARDVPAAFTVTNLLDDGSSGSLRWAVEQANSTSGADTVDFTSGLTGTIVLLGGHIGITDDLAIAGPGAGALTISGNGSSRIFLVDDGTFAAIAVTLSDLTLSNGRVYSHDSGGAISNKENLTVTASTIAGNTAYIGGGISNEGTITLNSSTLSGNTAYLRGAGIANNYTGIATISTSTLSGNNTAAGLGGGIYNSGGTVVITASTLTGNSASTSGGGIYNEGSLELQNSIVANSSTEDLFDPFGNALSTNSLIESADGHTIQNGVDGNIVGVDPMLGALANNGGPTLTHALLPGSPAVNAGNNSLVPAGVTTDQNGLSRIVGGTVDIGATEKQAVRWVASGSGNWLVGSNWSTGTVPGPNDDVVIDVPAQPGLRFTIIVQNGTATARSVRSDEQIELRAGGTLSLSGSLEVETLRFFDGGTVIGATVPAGTTTTVNGTRLGTLRGLTVAGTLNLPTDITLDGGLTLAGGTVVVGSDTTHQFGSEVSVSGTAPALAGTGTVRFGLVPTNATSSHGILLTTANSTLTIDPGVTVRGPGGVIGGPGLFAGAIPTSLVNRGVIEADGSRFIRVQGTNWRNEGTLRLSNAGGGISIAGSIATADLGTIERTAGTLTLVGTLNNAGAELILDTTPKGSMQLNGTVVGGTVTARDGVKIVTPGLVLNGVTVNADIDLSGSGRRKLSVRNGLTLNGTLSVGSPGAGTTDSTNYAEVEFAGGSQTLDGTATVVFGGSQYNDLTVYTETVGAAPVLTLGTGVTVRGGRGSIQADGVSGTPGLVNRGTILADGSGANITVGSGLTGWENKGELRTANGGRLAVNGTNWVNTGTFRVTSGTFVLAGSFTTAGLGTFARTGGTVVLTGFVDNRNSTLTLNSTTGSWELEGSGFTFPTQYGIRGGTVRTLNGVQLGIGSSVGLQSFVLDGVTLNGALEVRGNGRVLVQNGLTLSNGTVSLSMTGDIFQNRQAVLTFDGTQTLGGTGSVVFPANFNTFAEGLNRIELVTANTTLTVGPNVQLRGGAGTIGRQPGGPATVAVVNQGVIRAEVGNQKIVIDGTNWRNDGTIHARGGTVVGRGTSANFDAGTLTGGTWWAEAGGVLRLVNSGIVTNAANIRLDGATSQFYRTETGTTEALSTLATNSGGTGLASRAVLDLLGGRSLTLSGALANYGLIDIGLGSNLTALGGFTQYWFGDTVVRSGTGTLSVPAPNTITIEGGVVHGTGTLAGTVVLNGGFLIPGFSPGTITINGNYTQGPGGTVQLEIAGPADGQFDRLVVNGTVTLGGPVEFARDPGYTPALGQTFPFVSATSVTGAFSGVTGAGIGGGQILTAVQGSSSLTGAIVPNQAPTGASLSPATVAENAAVGTEIGTLSAIDPDLGDAHTFALLDDAGGRVRLVGNRLEVAGPIDFEATPTLTVRVRATDVSGLSVERTFVVTVTDGNQAPTNVTLSNSTVAENSALGTVVGTLSALDPDLGDTHTFALLDTAGGRFALVGNQLQVAGAIDFEATPTLTVRVRATDAGGLSFEKDLTVTVTNVTEVTGFVVQRGAAQRSYVRYVDVTLDSSAAAAAVFASGRVQVVKSNLNGAGAAPLPAGAFTLSVSGAVLTLDFGANGLGGNRISTAGDGYYTVEMSLDGDTTYETTRSFYRLLGDTNGDRKVDDADLAAINYAIANNLYVLDLDLNGDNSVNGADRLLVQRYRGRALAANLRLDG